MINYKTLYNNLTSNLKLICLPQESTINFLAVLHTNLTPGQT